MIRTPRLIASRYGVFAVYNSRINSRPIPELTPPKTARFRVILGESLDINQMVSANVAIWPLQPHHLFNI
jgi:hypothetical protein